VAREPVANIPLRVLKYALRRCFEAVITLSYKFGDRKYSISREAIVSAMNEVDGKVDRALPEALISRRGSKYFVWWRKKPYPPKELLRLMPNGLVGPFSGGNATNQVFRDLEFYVGKGKYP